MRIWQSLDANSIPTCLLWTFPPDERLRFREANHHSGFAGTLTGLRRSASSNEAPEWNSEFWACRAPVPAPYFAPYQIKS